MGRQGLKGDSQMNGGGQIRRQNMSVFRIFDKLDPCEMGGGGRGE